MYEPCRHLEKKAGEFFCFETGWNQTLHRSLPEHLGRNYQILAYLSKQNIENNFSKERVVFTRKFYTVRLTLLLHLKITEIWPLVGVKRNLKMDKTHQIIVLGQNTQFDKNIIVLGLFWWWWWLVGWFGGFFISAFSFTYDFNFCYDYPL